MFLLYFIAYNLISSNTWIPGGWKNMIEVVPRARIMKPRLKSDSIRSSNAYNPITIFTVIIWVLPPQSWHQHEQLNEVRAWVIII